MPILYFDASALVKLLVDETGSETAAGLWDAADLVACSLLGHVEVRAALAAAHRAGRLTDSDHREQVRAWTEDYWPAIAQVPLTPPTADRAGEIASERTLRGADAVHVASAGALPDAIVVAWDRRLREGAATHGLEVAPRHV
ncbi:MAG: type II toxin-antitoxin system VapC family toxin [Kineosporiaceae bacterium]